MNKFSSDQNLFRYCLNCTSSSPKSLNPKSLNSTSSLRHSVFIPSEPSPRQKRPALGISSSGSSLILHFGLRFLRTKRSRGSCSSRLTSYFFCNPFLPFENRFLGDSLCGLPSRYKLDLPTLSTHMVRCYTASSNKMLGSGFIVESEVQRKKYRGKFVMEVVDIVRSNGEDLECKLNKLHPRFSTYLITEIFEILNSQKVPGLRFFKWIWSSNPKLRKNSYVCSLVIDNLGRLEDYGTMLAWFRKFYCENICLTYVAFGFLHVFASSDAEVEESTKTVLVLLNEVGGSFRSSGVCALIEMFCKFHLFEMARYVIKVAGGKDSYYSLLIREKCRSGLIEDAHDIIREMREACCAPTTTVYNYLLGSLWKHSRINEASALLDEMKENDVPLDAITFEILIISACSLGNMDTVHKLLDQMVAQGLQPRLSTHACIIKTLFAAESYAAAYKYVVDSSAIHKTSSNVMYSLTAKLYREKGHIMSAQNTLVDMMEKGLKPDFSIYVNIVKELRRTGRGNLARDLESRHSKFMSNPHVSCL